MCDISVSIIMLFNNVMLKVPSGQIGSAWEWYHWIGLKKDINRFRFFIFYFWSWIFKTTSKFWAAPCKKASNPPACSLHGLTLHVLKPRSFSPNRAPKMRERHQLVFGLRLVSKEFYHSAIQTKIQSCEWNDKSVNRERELRTRIGSDASFFFESRNRR